VKTCWKETFLENNIFIKIVNCFIKI